MTQLLCNGTRLDLYDGTSLQYKHTNPLFAFDKLECERTTSFKLPCTPTNDRVLELARMPAYAGNGMRRRFSAQVISGTIIQNGYLYISKFDGQDYEGIFVCGDLVELQTFKTLGKIKDIISYTDVVRVGQNVQTPAQAASTIWANVNYERPDGATIRPSILLEQLYADICTRYGLTADPFPSSLQGLRWISGKAKGYKQDMQFGCSIIDSSQPDENTPITPYNALTYEGTLFDEQQDIYSVQELDLSKDYLLVQFRAKTNMKLTFPENWPADWYIVDFTGNGGGHELAGDGTTFYGERWFEKPRNGAFYPQGEPLAGRTITIGEGDVFSFVSQDGYINMSAGGLVTQGFFFGNAGSDYEGTRTIQVASENDPVDVAQICRLQDNLPDITFAELCKMLAYLSGTALNYTQAGGLTFDAVDIDNWQAQYVQALMKRGEVERTFGDYAQQNLVVFKSDSHVQSNLRIAYTIANDNLEQSKTLATIPASEGDSIDGRVYVEGDSDCLGTNDTGALLMRVSLPKNTGIQQLCTASTQYQVQARMTMLMYHAIDARTRLVVDGSAYVWTERAWQDDVAQFTLARL